MNVIPTEHFQSDVKYYIKKKKYFRIMDDIEPIIESIEHNDLPGEAISDVTSNNKTYKVRAANSSAGVGKSNGFRLIYYAVTDADDAYLLTIYSKKDDSRIPSDSDLRKIIDDIESP